MQSLSTSLRYALGRLRRSPGFASVMVLTLAVGIGLNTAIFTVVDNVLLRPLGYEDADRIVALQTHFDEENRSIPRLGGDDYNDLARDIRGLDATAHYANYAAGISLAGRSLYVPIAAVSPEFWQVIGVKPEAGRPFHAADRVGTDALVGDGFARDHFGGAKAALGQPITFEGTTYTVAGVLPPGFSFPGRTAVWLEAPPEPLIAHRTAYNERAIGRRRSGVSPAQFSAELAAFSKRLQRSFPEDRNKSIEAVPLQEQIVGPVRPTLHLLMASVMVVLLIVAANLTHLQLVRATRGARALSIRTALGASRRALAMQALAEIALLALAGSVAALALAVPALGLLVRLAPPDVPRLNEVHLNVDVLLFSALISFAVMGVATLLPVWRSWRLDPAATLSADSTRGAESRGSLRLRNALVIAEIALTLTLSVAAILLTRQLLAQSRQDLGFQPDHLLLLDTHAVVSVPERVPPEPQHPSPAAAAARSAELRRVMEARLSRLQATFAAVESTPGVSSAAAVYGAPMADGGSDVSYAIQGRQTLTPEARNLPHADLREVTPGFFDTLGVPLLRGRGFTAGDRLGGPKVLLINDALARTVFANQDPIGQKIVTGFDDNAGDYETVIGVVGDIRSDSPALPAQPTLYLPSAQHADWADDMQILVRTPLAPATMTEMLRRSLRRSHPEVAVAITTMREEVSAVQRPEHFRTTLFGLFAGVSVLLAALGVYGVTGYTVAQRRFEFGLRLALGATRDQVLARVLGDAVRVAGMGVVLGGVLSLGLLRFVASVAGDLPRFDPLTYTVAALAVLSMAVLAAALPAHRAAAVEPMTVLRNE